VNVGFGSTDQNAEGPGSPPNELVKGTCVATNQEKNCAEIYKQEGREKWKDGRKGVDKILVETKGGRKTTKEGKNRKEI